MKKRILALTCAVALLISGNGSITASAAGKKPVSLSGKTITLKAGKSKILKVKKSGKVKIKSKTFKSSNKKVATVTKKTGKIKAKKAGKATITVKVKYVKKPGKKVKITTLKCKVKVTAATAGKGDATAKATSAASWMSDVDSGLSTPSPTDNNATSIPALPTSIPWPSLSPTESPKPSPSGDSRVAGLYNAQTGKMEKSWEQLLDEGILEINDYGGLDVAEGKQAEITGVLVIGSDVVGVSWGAFASCEALTEVSIPDNVTYIDGGAFSGCKNLSEIRIPSTLTSFTSAAFEGTPWYEKQKEHDFVIINSVLLKCNKENEEIRIPDGVTHIGEMAFYFHESLQSIYIPNSVTHIETFAFTGCKLKELKLPNSITYLAGNAFSMCDSLTSIYIPASVTKIDYMAKSPNPFTGCVGITEIVVDKDNPVYDSRNNCNAIIETKTNTLVTGCQTSTIPDGVTKIMDDAFYQCRDTGIEVPDSVIELGECSFEDVPWIIYDGDAEGYPWGAFEVRRSNGTMVYPEGANAEDVWALKKLIAEQQALGADVSADLGDYDWDEHGNLVSINWVDRNLQGDISFSKLKHLESLDCFENQLISLDVSGCIVLGKLYCFKNQLTSLGVSNCVNLTKIDCSDNELRNLDVSSCVNLAYLECAYNQLRSLELTNNTKLEHFCCDCIVDFTGYEGAWMNPSSTNLEKNAEEVKVLRELITRQRALGAEVSEDLDSEVYIWDKNGNLLSINWGGSNLQGDISFSELKHLEKLRCSWNELNSLDVSGNTALTKLDCFGNALTSLDLTNNTLLTDLSCDDSVIIIGYSKAD